MSRTIKNAWLPLLMVGACAVLTAGCANLPRIDPSGERFFLSPESPCGTQTAPPEGPYSDPFLAPVPSPPDSTQPNYIPSGPVPDYQEIPGGACAPDGQEVMLTPRLTIAPAGSEVVLLAGVLGSDRYLRTNQRIEWTIDGSGVGQFVELGGKSAMDWLVGDFNWPQKLNSTSAVGITTREYLLLTRGTKKTDDDVRVLRGQAWITVTSPVEGTSRVTAFSPCVANWGDRKRTATIHWVDAQWTFPPPSINPAGSRHVFTTTVTRHTDQSPCVGWLVRYEILDGPPAGFAPSGAQVLEVPTNTAGQAAVEIFQSQSTPGINRVDIQVIRPAAIDGAAGRRLVVGQGTTSKTWSSADITIHKTGPSAVGIGATLNYRINVTNPGDLAADNVVVTDEIPEGTTYLSSEPPGRDAGQLIRWTLDRLAPGEIRPLAVRLRADRPGSVTSCAEASIPSGAKARDCVDTMVAAPAINVTIEGPSHATVGEEVIFTMNVVNQGNSPTGPLRIKDRFDVGLEHAVAVSPIEKVLANDLLPGQSISASVAFNVTQPGQLHHTVEILDANRAPLASSQAYLTATMPPITTPPPVIIPPRRDIEPPPPYEPEPSPVSLLIQGPQNSTVGETVLFTMEVQNTSSQTLQDLLLICRLGPDFDRERCRGTDGELSLEEFKRLRDTPGSQITEDDIVAWPIDSLSPSLPGDKPTIYQIETRCANPADKACCQARIVRRGVVVAENEACLQIEMARMFAPTDLEMTIEDLHDPITAGQEYTYEIRVDNRGQQPDHNVVLAVTIPPELRTVRLHILSPTGYDIVDSTIYFNPVPQIEPGGGIVYRVRVQARSPGDVRLQAQLTSQKQPQPLFKEEETTITPAQ